MGSREPLVLGSDMLVELCNLTDEETGELVTGATVTGNVYDSNDVLVPNSGSPITFSEVAGRTGMYRGTILATAGYANGDDVTIQVTAVDGGRTRVFTTLGTVVEVL